MVERLLHLGYFVKSADYRRLLRCIEHVRKQHRVGRARQLVGMFRHGWMDGASFEDYFDFRLFVTPVGG